jgi:hypothetical protein
MYNLSLALYSSKELGTIKTLRKILEITVSKINYIVVGDFNLYYPL